MSVRLRRALPTVLLAGTVLVSGCAGSDSGPKADGKPTNSAPGARPSPSTVVPDGIAKPGTALPVGDGAWTVTLQGFERLPADAEPGVPAGSSAYRARVTVANQRAQVATAPRTAVTARYGALGRTAAEATDSSTASAKDDPQQVRPNGSVDRDLKLVLPDQAQGPAVTVTVEATEEGLAEPELLFFEGALPGGAPASPDAQAPQGAPARQSVTPLGQWNGHVRVGKVTVSGEGAARTGSLELSVVNRSGDPMPGLGTTLRILTGQDLHLAATVRPVFGYRDAAIAPYRTATQSVSFRAPEAAVGGPVTVEAVDAGGSRITFEGTLG
ncbi:hypothetical protein AR457_40100 [Streptomyces agglomeratus]|uniref:hypothetical protein n=1 Tax=Streptomyces agglomeratus TaxID=285458 RepID=UPI00085266D4|nr:hypothetical protein [Streptomyces agglomeratus]OEJ22093.1 hypothetical protein AR457_40100 [Streptomyces agglomeratus]OEJ36930.1 hypothetical protein BGK70_00755 [Streptomyces agglomeratus]